MGGWYSKTSGVGDLFVRVTSDQLDFIRSSLEELGCLHDELLELEADELPSKNSGKVIREALDFYSDNLPVLQEENFKPVLETKADMNSEKVLVDFSSLGFGDRVCCERLGEGTVISVARDKIKVRFGSRRLEIFSLDDFVDEKFSEVK